MTNVPGIVPQPYPIVNYPGTFAIILRKVATPFSFLFFWGEVLIANQLIFRGAFFGEKKFGGIFFGGYFSDGRWTAVGRPPDAGRTAIRRRSDGRLMAVRRPSDKE